jgi:hypothetical protein
MTIIFAHTTTEKKDEEQEEVFYYHMKSLCVKALKGFVCSHWRF